MAWTVAGVGRSLDETYDDVTPTLADTAGDVADDSLLGGRGRDELRLRETAAGR